MFQGKTFIKHLIGYFLEQNICNVLGDQSDLMCPLPQILRKKIKAIASFGSHNTIILRYKHNNGYISLAQF